MVNVSWQIHGNTSHLWGLQVPCGLLGSSDQGTASVLWGHQLLESKWNLTPSEMYSHVHDTQEKADT